MFHQKEGACVCGAGCDNHPGLIITQCTHTLHSINLYSYCVSLKRERETGREADRKGTERKKAGSENRAQLCGRQ